MENPVTKSPRIFITWGGMCRFRERKLG